MKNRIFAILMTLALLIAFPAGVLAETSGEPPEGMPGEPPEGMGEPPEGMGQPPEGGMPGGFGGGTPPGGGSADFEYVAATEITEAAEASGETYESTTVDESALIVDTDADVTLSDITVSKTGDSDGGDSCNFYGLNAALLVMGGSTTTITGATITSDASGANGVFSYGGNGGQNGGKATIPKGIVGFAKGETADVGNRRLTNAAPGGDGTTVVISDSTITTTGDGSGGIMTTGGGVTTASNLTIDTSGRSSAAIRTDRGGGTVVVDGGSYTTNGLGSPAIYSTADITVSNATLTSNLSEGVCIEGKNSITLIDCDMTANNTAMNSNATFLDTIMIYQSMSGDADSGESHFTMTGGSLTSQSGHMFHVTNTNAVITLTGVALVNEGSDVLLSVCDDGWSGASNVATLNAVGQALTGTILVGGNSALTLNLTEGSTFEGTVSGAIENARGETISTEVGNVSVTLDDTSTWTLTADAYITEFNGDLANVDTNGHALYVNGVQY